MIIYGGLEITCEQTGSRQEGELALGQYTILRKQVSEVVGEQKQKISFTGK